MPPKIAITSREYVSIGIITIIANSRGTTSAGPRGPLSVEGFDLLGDDHRAQLGGDGRAGAAGDHDAGEHRPELAYRS